MTNTRVSPRNTASIDVRLEERSRGNVPSLVEGPRAVGGARTREELGDVGDGEHAQPDGRGGFAVRVLVQHPLYLAVRVTSTTTTTRGGGVG